MTVLLNKQRHDHDIGRDYRWLSASASYILNGDTIDRIAAIATLRRPAGGGDPQPVLWNPRTND